jgi:phage-related protein (TIGR01555 family)
MSKTKHQRIQQNAMQSQRVNDAAPAPSPAPELASAATGGQVNDSYQNFAARIGVGTGNLGDGSSYGFNPVTRKRAELEYMYRGSWIAQIAVDAVADDMTRAGIDFGQLDPDEIDALTGDFEQKAIWPAIGDTLRWSRLYGGAIAVILIEGQNLATPLRIESIAKGQFKGLLVLDRWTFLQQYDHLVQDLGPDLGKPKFYTIGPQAPALQNQRVHYSRIIRFDGKVLPYYQRLAEQGWGMSVIEPVWDRMVAFDSATQAAAQLVYKSHLRVMSVEGLKKILAAGGPAFDALVKNIQSIRQFQSTEGMSIIDATDKLETQVYNFSGLAEIIIQFGQQISGNLQIPMVRLFGQSPVGMNATGESDLRTYYDGCASKQESQLRVPVSKVIDIAYRSLFGKAIPAGFKFKFNALWLLREEEKADIAGKITTLVVQAHESGIVDRPTALKELRASADESGTWHSITDDIIKEAEEEPPIPTPLDPKEATAKAKLEEAGKTPEPGKNQPNAGAAVVKEPVAA